ncbi:hypothetical protein AY601_2152 [Pedobacter cryoconitis]|uniref:Methylamine utilisation protein MauE domain-containing protein n=1 Tax=Pedobacter cryoconitis TaxID=188932 RepID=A0A127VCG2_9SPHI|nr:MauE/DoxX family redox-associated membrane protein [Pedobacter cryoconitis]AMP99053.1 hypothetical protein AY601_2152 [Pedobacter cryoconitis]
MRREIILQGIATAIALLFCYAALSKLTNFATSRSEMLNQVFPESIALILVWVVPITELFIVALLLYKPLRLMGFYASLILLSLFTIYIAITMTGVFGRIPCSCGGILKHMSYSVHLIFNVFFLLLALAGILLKRNMTINSHISLN